MDSQLLQQQHIFTLKTVKLFAVLSIFLCLIPLYRAFANDELYRLLFLISCGLLFLSLKLCKSSSTLKLGHQLFSWVMIATFFGLYFTNGMFNSLTFLWGFVFALVIFVAVGQLMGKISFAIVIITLLSTRLAVDYGFLANFLPRTTSTAVESAHISVMLFFIYHSFSRFIELSKLPVAMLEQLFEKEQQLNSAKDTFLSNMSHELRTPLNGIYGALQIVKGENDAEKSLLKAAKHSAQALNRIVSDILDIQKLSEGKVELAPEWCNSQTFFNNISQLHLSSTALLDIELHVNVHPSVPKKLYCDETRLGQVINNIMGNAIKFTHQGSVTLLVHYHDNTLHLDVTDTGIGMDEAALSHLFDRFTQADASITKKYQGTGLGMAITKELVDLMHGTIEVTSTPGEGTTFSVAIPMQGSQQTHSNNADSNIRLAHKDIRILLVDDVDTNTLIGREILRPHFSLVDTASSGSEALVKLDASSYDLLITDIGMPGMSGEELHHAVKAQMPHLPIIALTGNASREDRERYLGMGFDGVTVKPFQLEDLLSLIHGVFETKQSAELG